MSITFHNLWLLLTVLCTAGIRADDIWNDCLASSNGPPLKHIEVLCNLAEQLRGLPDTVSSAVISVTEASIKASKAKVQAEEAVELAESKGLNVTKAKEAAVRATLAAEAAATAASNVEINAANIAELPWSQRRRDAGLQNIEHCKNLDKDVREAAVKCTKKAENVTADSLRAALEGLETLFSDVYILVTLRKEKVEMQEEMQSLEQNAATVLRVLQKAEDAAADANREALGNSVASPEGSVLLLMAGLFLGSVL
ncbi:BARP protein [Trypanosoma brucei brucei TREU927]|uniref:BARP protein n=1 Tax=Trypanosoma brucei brucei (strain 927/4 GUTat10.1) TaxID=185431 RepID=Q38CV1_TRYB2|nr:bloodstream stage alanine-rich protein BARP [Trypanosoma brucei brucei TREU927]EAN77369.1 BARP protein [Trypanosoma brucei brucei TREU927]